MHTASVNYNLPAERSHNGCVVRRRDGCGNGRLHPTVRGACSLARSANLIHTVRSHRRYVRTSQIHFKSGVRSSKISSRGSAPHPARAHALDPRRVTIDNILLPGRVGNYWTNIFDKFGDPYARLPPRSPGSRPHASLAPADHAPSRFSAQPHTPRPAAPHGTPDSGSSLVSPPPASRVSIGFGARQRGSAVRRPRRHCPSAGGSGVDREGDGSEGGAARAAVAAAMACGGGAGGGRAARRGT